MPSDPGAFVFVSDTFGGLDDTTIASAPSTKLATPLIEVGERLEQVNIVDVERWHAVKRDGQVSEREVMAVMKDTLLEEDRSRKRQRGTE
ncbi:uncharacterized protein SPSK_10076 [Sporothrix schenckii 1099-18]|uniref:Uncharacterized protein n=1 Tax=Sporothrix schenckii 1099-18 TaxID=1397361 RepID=A0A0F2MAC0_SPOSC|nr:uncharacterized protein SPSK_10076 [Sporothrix schenckii 1099-18]KJR86019.1 hypothetical protein SPSK_10076 [Sporothrix schenckii 1099-18]